LKRPRDFAFAMGKEIEVHTYKAIDNNKEWRGILKAYDGKLVTFETETGEMVLAKSDISKINLAFDF
ncbi:MAG: ribosome maturation factor RimP, partial [Lachnospiraceae bacterium]|nr:ribosome maturation factor RimP [Candidatus Equihabitans merdae]